MKNILQIVLLFSLVTCSFSCDAWLNMGYIVENRSHKTIKLKVTGFPLEWGRFSARRDTIIVLKPGAGINVGSTSGIGMNHLFGNRSLFKKEKGIQNFDLLVDDSIVVLDKSDKRWHYIEGNSVYKIRKSDIPKKIYEK